MSARKLDGVPAEPDSDSQNEYQTTAEYGTVRIIARADEIARIDVRQGTRGIGIDVRLEKEHSQRLAQRRRAIPGQSGCGICGLTTIEEALPKLAPLTAAPRLPATALFKALAALPARQILNQETGAVHAASFCRTDGDILAVRED